MLGGMLVLSFDRKDRRISLSYRIISSDYHESGGSCEWPSVFLWHMMITEKMMMTRRTLTAQYSRKMTVVRDDGFIYMFAGCWFPPSLQREKNVLIPIAS